MYLNTHEEIWGMIYGEIFMNLERNSKRTKEISSLLYKTYQSEIKITNDTQYSISFSKNNINVNDLSNFKMPFSMVYELNYTTTIAGIKKINLGALDTIRTRFLNVYFETKLDSIYPNVLFDYQRKVQSFGHMESYNRWIVMKGNESEMATWLENAENKEKWDAFMVWFALNPLILSQENKFYRMQY